MGYLYICIHFFRNKNHYMKSFFTLLLTFSFIAAQPAKAADTLRVLFIGNSYTAVNNLPQVFKDMAAAAGQVIITDENTPGGYTFQQHSTNATTLAKISAGNWDYVVLQEQSQYPSFPPEQVAAEVFPYARFLDSFAKAKNPCAQTVFYMTWGRKNGDASNCAFWPPVCTYEGMDSLLRQRYIEMAEDNNAVISPAGAVWRYLRTHAPEIELYSGDESHPAFAGTYAVAAAFYAALLRKDPTDVTYTGSLSASVAAQIRAAAKTVVFDSLNFWRGHVIDPTAGFTVSGAGANYSFTSTAANATDFQWFFGDGASATTEDAAHTYEADGPYEVMFVASHCKVRDTARQTIVVTGTGTGIAQQYRANGITATQQGATLWLNNAGALQDTRVSLFNLTGQKLQSTAWPAHERRLGLDVTPLRTGVYVIVLEQAGGTYTLKVTLR